MNLKRVPAKSLKEVIARMRALHVETLFEKYPPQSADGYFEISMSPALRWNSEAHEEMDRLMLDAFELLGQRDIVQARKVVEKSYEGFWYA